MEQSAAESKWLVRISKPGGGVVGAGLVVDDRHVLTCAHVVLAALQLGKGTPERPAGSVTLDLPALGGDAKALAEVAPGGWIPITEDGRGDIAVLEGDLPRDAMPPLLRKARGTSGHRIEAYGFPRNVDSGILATGTLLERVGPGWEWIQIGVGGLGAPIESGFSGSPVWDRDLGAGAVVGIVVAQDRRHWVGGGAPAAFMIPIDVLMRAWPPLSELVQSPLLLDPALGTHWDPRARGVELAAVPGWYFTGRTKVLRELADWLRAPLADPAPRVVIGSPGSGKSAVLARLVTLSDPQYRRSYGFPEHDADQSTMPPDGAINIAVHARGKTLHQLVRMIADTADVRLADAEAADAADEEAIELLVNELMARAPLTIVIDSIAEAEQPYRVARKLLQRLARLGPNAGVRLLVGGRRELLEALGAGWKPIDLDDPANIDRTDLARYVERMIVREHSGHGSPYNTQPDLARKVAMAVAARAYPLFLIAQLTARALIESEDVVDIRVPGWDDFPATVDAAMDQYLSRFNDGDDRRRAQRLLGALAWAEGEGGLPRETIWPAVAGAISGGAYDDRDVQWLLDHAAAFVVAREADGVPTYNLYHAALAFYLRKSLGRPAARVQGKIAEALLATVPLEGDSRDWASADPYIKAHLAAHAMAAAQDSDPGLLDTLLTDPGFLLSAEPQRLLRAEPKAASKPARLSARAFLLAVHQLRNKPQAERSAYLEFAARRTGALDLAERIESEGLDRPWSVRWINGRTDPASQVIGSHDDSVNAVAFALLEERPHVVSGGDDRQVRVWDLIAADRAYDPLVGHTDSVYAVTVGTLDGRPIIVSGSRDQTIRFWDLTTGQRIGAELQVNGRVHALAIGTRLGSPVVVAGLGDNTVRVWELAEPHREVLRPLIHTQRVHAVAVGTLDDGRPIIVSGSRDRTVHVWSLDDGSAIVPPLRGPTESVNAVAIGSNGEQSVIAAGDDDATILIWELAPIAAGRESAPRRLRGWHTDAVQAVAVGTLDWQPVIVSGSRDRTVRIWDLAKNEPSRQPLEQARPIRGLALGRAEGGRVIAFGGEDGMVRVWNPPTGTPISILPTSGEETVNAVAASSLSDEPLVVSGADDGTIRLWNLDTGEPTGHAIEGHDGAVNSVAVGVLDGEPVLASGGEDRTIRVWSLRIGEPTRPPTEHRDAVNTVAIGSADGQPVLVSGGEDDMIRVWDLKTGAPVGGPLTDHAAPVNALALATLDGTPVVVSGSDDGTVRVWDLVKGTPIGRPLASHANRVYTVAAGMLNGRPIVAAGGTHSLVNVWDLASRAPVGRPLAGHEGPVNSMAIDSLNGRTVLATGDDSGTVRVWDLAGRPREPAIEVDTGFSVRAVAFAAKSTIAVGGSNRLLVVQVRRFLNGPPESAARA